MNFNWSNLVNHLKSISPFLFYRNSGNAGDMLIQFATEKFFQTHNISYVEYSNEAYKTNKNIVYSGGGTFVEYYEHCAQVIAQHQDSCKTFTLLPHTITGHTELLNSLDNRFHLFARELKSLDYLSTASPNSQHYLSQDLAFFLKSDDLLGLKPPPVFPHLDPKLQIKWLKALSVLRKIDGSTPSSFYRVDCESSQNIRLPEENVDISRLFEFRHKTPAQRSAITSAFVRAVVQSSDIYTDRLHVSICGAILGKNVTLSAGAYYKNHEIFKHSLKHFDCVTFKA